MSGSASLASVGALLLKVTLLRFTPAAGRAVRRRLGPGEIDRHGAPCRGHATRGCVGFFRVSTHANPAISRCCSERRTPSVGEL